MATKKKPKQPLALRVLKTILIVLGCAILIAAIIARIIHFYKYHISK